MDATASPALPPLPFPTVVPQREELLRMPEVHGTPDCLTSPPALSWTTPFSCPPVPSLAPWPRLHLLITLGTSLHLNKGLTQDLTPHWDPASSPQPCSELLLAALHNLALNEAVAHLCAEAHSSPVREAFLPSPPALIRAQLLRQELAGLSLVIKMKQEPQTKELLLELCLPGAPWAL